MYYNVEVYSGVLVVSELCRSYIYPEIDKFMDEEHMSQEKQSIVRDKIDEMINMALFDYHKKVRLAIRKSLSSKLDNESECQFKLIGDAYYDIYISVSEELNEDLIASKCLELASQASDENSDSLIDDIKLSVKSIMQNELNKDFNLDIQISDVVRDLEVIEVHFVRSWKKKVANLKMTKKEVDDILV